MRTAIERKEDSDVRAEPALRKMPVPIVPPMAGGVDRGQ